MKTVWITGAGGLIGANLIRLAPQARVIGLTRDTLDLTDFKAVETRFAQDRPRLVVHLAAMSKTADCATNPALARKVNVETTAHLAELTCDVDFIFFSTDLVFDGQRGWYVETDATNPVTMYGETKAEAEAVVTRNPRHTVVRLALCGGKSPKGTTAFNEDVEAMWRAGKVPKFFADEYRTPIAAPVVAKAIWALADNPPPGIFHLGGSKRLSRVDMGRLLAERHPELSPKFESGSVKDFKGPPRAPDTSLRSDKIQKLLPFALPGLDDWLKTNPQEPF